MHPDRLELHGLQVGISLSARCSPNEAVVEQIDEALTIIQRVWPRAYTRLRSDLDWISVKVIVASGELDSTGRVCTLDTTLFAGDNDVHRQSDRQTLLQIASTIIHEACHARLSTMGFARTDSLIVREEELCRKQEARFMEKARSSKFCPIDKDYDAAYYQRFGMWDRWFYDQRDQATRNDRIQDQLKRAYSGDSSFVFERFLNHVWSGQEQYVSYVEDLRCSLNGDSTDAQAAYLRGVGYCEIRRFSDGVIDLQRSVALKPVDNVAAWQALGEAAYYSGQRELAISSFEQLLELEPTNLSALIWIVSLTIRDEAHRHKANDFADRLAAEQPYQHRMLLYRAWARAANEQYESAAKFIEQALEYHPECQWGLRLAQEVFSKVNRIDEAANCWSEYCRCYDKEKESYKEPINTRGTILRVSPAGGRYWLSVMASTDAKQETTRSLAEKLLEQTKAEPKTVRDEYLHSMIRRPLGEKDQIELPTSVAGRPKIFVSQLEIPARVLNELGVPEVGDEIALCIDGADASSYVHRLQITSAT